MHADDLAGWQHDLVAFHARFASIFARSESRHQSLEYIRGLMSPIERKNGWQLAQHSPDALQRLLYRATWSADEARDRLLGAVIEDFAHPDAIGVLDETGFLKKGTQSVGVARQYSGTAGKIDNCQIGVFLAYVANNTHLLIDRRLYLPQVWCDDAERRERAAVPSNVRFQTKPELALAMLEHCWASGLAMRWVTGDEVYGNPSHVREFIAAHDRLYVLAVSSSTPVWLERPATIAPAVRAAGDGPKLNGRPRLHRRLAVGGEAAQSVAAIAGGLAETSWRRLALLGGEKGARRYDWARLRVVESRTGLDGPDEWLLIRRSIQKPEELAYYLSNAPEQTSLEELVGVAMQRYRIEQCFGEVKGELGLDQYEVRTWHSWHRHVTLTLIAHVWLASMRARYQKIRGKGVSHRTGRTESGGSASSAGDRSSTTGANDRVASEMVNVPATKAPAGTHQSLQATRRKPR